MQINILSKAPKAIPDDEIYKSIAVEIAIINHCRANMSFSTSYDRNKKLHHVEKHAMERYEVLMEIIS